MSALLTRLSPRRLVRRVGDPLFAFPSLARFVLNPAVGREYGVGPARKLRLVLRFARNMRRVETLSSLAEHVELADALLRLPREVEGDVVECGCYVGGSSVNLSIACALVGRRLLIHDSFEGLPEPRDYDRVHVSIDNDWEDAYYAGRFAAGLDTVKDNIARNGAPEVCEYVKGFFDQTMPQLDRPVAMAFLDVDFIDSLRPCLVGIWPRLQPQCRVYVHEARSLALVATFFAQDWWREHVGEDAPGFVGAGTGLPLAAIRGSELGYAQKGTRAVLA